VKLLLENFGKKKKPYIDPSEVRVLILDEADQLLGHQSSPDVFNIRELIPRISKRECQIGLFSATYKDQIKLMAKKFVFNDIKLYHEITLRKEDLTLDRVDNFFVIVGGQQDNQEAIFTKKCQAVLDVWKSLSDANIVGQTIIFVRAKGGSQKVSEFFRGKGYDVGQIHGDLDKVERDKVFKEFCEHKRPHLVATNVLSRGIDNPNVKVVIHFDLPDMMNHRYADPETFIHRIGRASRWKNRGASVSLISANPSSKEKTMLAEIERVLFAEVDRPLIQLAEASQVGVEWNERLKRTSTTTKT